MMANALIQQLGLSAHPEGGYYKETYRAVQQMEAGPGKFRSVSTAIYFMLENDDRSLFHRIQSDELWFFHLGESLEIVYIVDGALQTIVLGAKLEHGEVLQATIPANTWFASCLKNPEGYALVSCTVAPGFDFADFELADREILLQEFPRLAEVIQKFTNA